MPQKVLIPLEIPTELERFSLPSGLNQRLQDLLDKQDSQGALTEKERKEAEGLADLSELLSLLKWRSITAASHPE